MYTRVLLACPLLGGLSSFGVSFVGRFVLFWSVLCREVCPLSEYPLSEVPRYYVYFMFMLVDA